MCQSLVKLPSLEMLGALTAQCSCHRHTVQLLNERRLAGRDSAFDTRMAIYSAGHFRQGWSTSANVTPQDALAITLWHVALQCGVTVERTGWRSAARCCCGRLDVRKLNAKSTSMGVPFRSTPTNELCRRKTAAFAVISYPVTLTLCLVSKRSKI